MARVLPKVETVLAGGDTAPGSFTLHEEGHSHRVAQRMAELAGAEVIAAVEPYDLGALLLSAYLHDIGMTPKQSNLDGLLAYLLSADPEALEAEEQTALQTWLDESAYGISPPLSEGAPSAAVIRQARSLVARYVRARHNDWSAAWMEENLAEIDDETYSGFLSDVILLCKSHHFGYDMLRDDAFEPRLVGTPGTVLNLRFDACLLRIADVLDFDPERTPKILYDHRDVEKSSAIFWHKDHNLAFVQKGGSLRIHARPPDALTHHAIDLTVRDIDRELQLCRRLVEEAPIDRMGDLELPHRWMLETNVRVNIKPRDGAYEYMDGTFRPDQERILELLGGTALYGSPLAAVRELLQNAFDAVRERIAYQRLQEDKPAVPETLERIAANHSVSLTLDQTDEGVRLVCRDSGAGMSREIIRSRFLVGGSTASRELRELERRCRDKGFSIGRTARFGIGVLAYFLLGSRLEVRTRRLPEGVEAAEATGWIFVSDGLTDFGELRRNPGCPVGTEVELLIRAEAMPEGSQRFAEELSEYVRTTVRRAPCHFSFVARGSDAQPVECEPGWTRRTEEATDSFLTVMAQSKVGLEQADTTLYSARRRQEIESAVQRWDKVREQAAELLSLSEEEDELPDRLGSYRIFLGHFAMEDGPLLLFMDLRRDEDGTLTAFPIERSTGVEMGGALQMSWNGMSVEHQGDHPVVNQAIAKCLHSGIYLEIDWTSDAAGELAVDRGTMSLSAPALKAIEAAGERAVNLQQKLVRESESSPFALLNAHVADVATPKAAEPLWIDTSESRQDPTEPVKLKPLGFPVVDPRRFEVETASDLRWRGEKARVARQMEMGAMGMSWPWHGRLFTPQLLGARMERGRMRPVLVWTAIEVRESPTYGFLVDFPPEWQSLISVAAHNLTGPPLMAWNVDHPVVKAVDVASWEWASQTLLQATLDPVPHEGELMKAPGRVASWILKCLENGTEAIWSGLAERAPLLLADAWSLLGLPADFKIYSLSDEYGSGLSELTSSGWEIESGADGNRETLAQVMPEPGEDWWITTSDGKRDLPGKSELFPF